METAMLKAGRELDALVERLVMGFVWDERRCRVCGWPLAETAEKGCVPDNCSLRPRPQVMADEPAPYSTEMTAAWQVLELLKKIDLVRIELGPEESIVKVGHYGFADNGGWGEWYGKCEAEAGPGELALAICRAALKAVSG